MAILREFNDRTGWTFLCVLDDEPLSLHIVIYIPFFFGTSKRGFSVFTYFPFSLFDVTFLVSFSVIEP